MNSADKQTPAELGSILTPRYGPLAARAASRSYFYRWGVPNLPSLQTSETCPVFTQTAWHDTSVLFPLHGESPQTGRAIRLFPMVGNLDGNRVAVASAVECCKPFPQLTQSGRSATCPADGARRHIPLKSIFPPPNLSKNCGERLADLPELFLNLRAVRAQERILSKLIAELYREGKLALSPQLLDLPGPLLQGGISGLDCKGESRIALGVFVTAIDARLGGKFHQLLQGVPHHRGVPFQQASAAQREQRVADEDDLRPGQPVADMPQRMAGRLDHADGVAAQVETVAFRNLTVDAGYAGRLISRADNVAAGLRLQRFVTGGMVAVMMCSEDVREAPSLSGKRGPDRLGFRSIDRGGDAMRGIVDENAEIILAAEKLMDIERGHRAITPVVNATLGLPFEHLVALVS